MEYWHLHDWLIFLGFKYVGANIPYPPWFADGNDNRLLFFGHEKSHGKSELLLIILLIISPRFKGNPPWTLALKSPIFPHKKSGPPGPWWCTVPTACPLARAPSPPGKCARSMGAFQLGKWSYPFIAGWFLETGKFPENR